MTTPADTDSTRRRALARVVGVELRQLRERARLTVEEVAERLHWSATKVNRLEAAQTMPHESDAQEMLELYGANEHQRDELLALLDATKSEPKATRPTMGFEEMLQTAVSSYTNGRDWRSVSWPPGMGTGSLRRALDAQAPLPPWRLVGSLLQQLSVPPAQQTDFRLAYEMAKVYRPWSDTVRISTGPDEPSTYVINNSGSLHLHPERQTGIRPRRRATPVIKDAEGYSDLKPDPLSTTTLAALEERMRAFWAWAGRPSSRTIASNSAGTFSHATVAKLIGDKAGKPPLTLKYLIGVIRGCGGDEDDQQRWATAWRIIDQRQNADGRPANKQPTSSTKRHNPDDTHRPPATAAQT